MIIKTAQKSSYVRVLLCRLLAEYPVAADAEPGQGLARSPQRASVDKTNEKRRKQ